MPKPDCAKCGHSEGAHKRLDGSYRIDCYIWLPEMDEWCECDGYEPMMEDSDALPVHSDRDAVRADPGLPAVHDLAQRHLTAARQTLLEVGTDLLGRIRAIGDTMTAEAARLRGEE